MGHLSAGSLSNLKLSTQLKSPAIVIIPLALPANSDVMCLKKLDQSSFGAYVLMKVTSIPRTDPMTMTYLSCSSAISFSF